MKKNQNTKGISLIFILIFIALVLGAVMFVIWNNMGKSSAPLTERDFSAEQPEIRPTQTSTQLPTSPPSATPEPKIYPLIPDNGTAGTYNVSQGPHSGPTFRRVIFDPLDVKKDQELKITVILESTSGVGSLTGVFQMDNSSTNTTFQRLSRQGTTETWEVKFTLTDSVNYKYILRLTANDSGGTSTMGVAPRS